MSKINLLVGVTYLYRTDQALWHATFYGDGVELNYRIQIRKNGVPVYTAERFAFVGWPTAEAGMMVITDYLEMKKAKKNLPASPE